VTVLFDITETFYFCFPGFIWHIMACVDRMEQLSLVDTDQPSSAPVQGDCLGPLPFKQAIVAAKLDGIHTDIVISEFRYRLLLSCQCAAPLKLFTSL